MEELKSQIDPKRLPEHVAIIMDGNGRWAKKKGKLRVFGHKSGVTSVRETCETSAEIGIKYLTLYAFSTENWNRPKREVNALMQLLVKTIRQEMKTLMDNGIKLDHIGDMNMLPTDCKDELLEAKKMTANNNRMTLILALSYSSKWDIVNAVKQIAREVKEGNINPDQIDESHINNALATSKYPHPELLIRTSGELRISNFLLWELAYSEFYFTPVLWPDFRKEHLYDALIDYQKRERRFGKTSEQVVA